jgi:hypothetical protein
MTDDEIRDIYQTKLRSIDLGQRRGVVEQHKASVSMNYDPYSHFRDVPNFSNNGSSLSSNNSSDLMKTYGLKKKIAGSNN